MRELLFVYGSLRGDMGTPGRTRLGQKMRKLLCTRARKLGSGSIAAQLFAVNANYPGAVAAVGGRSRVQGELYALGSKVLAQLDTYEGCAQGNTRPYEFVRVRCRVQLRDATHCEAWVYYYNRSTRALRRIISGDYRGWRRKRRYMNAGT